MKWNFSKSITENEPHFIQNINIWDKEWKDTGEKLEIYIHNKFYKYPIFEIEENGLKIKFSATEISNNVWRIYEPENKKLKSINKKLLIIGIIFIFTSILMFVFGVGMFVSRADYSQFIIKLSEFCFIFWLPFLYIGILLIIIAFIIKIVKSSKTKS